MNIDLESILKQASRVYQSAEPGLTCPSMSDLCDYHYGDISSSSLENIKNHLASCEVCRLSLMRIETESAGWDLLRRDILDKGFVKAHVISTNSIGQRVKKFVSSLTDEMIEWVSPAWTPVWGTAMTNEPQARDFEMGGGEYINLSCYWQGSAAGSPAFIHLEWTANILSSSRLWVRFSDPETHELLYEELLGEELLGKRDLDTADLSFDPSRRRWTISLVVEVP